MGVPNWGKKAVWNYATILPADDETSVEEVKSKKIEKAELRHYM